MADELRAGRFAPEAGKVRLLETRKKVERGWRAVSKLLAARGERELAAEVNRFVAQMPPPRAPIANGSRTRSVNTPCVRHRSVSGRLHCMKHRSANGSLHGLDEN